MTTTIASFQDAAGWERTLYAFLAEKERRSGSRRTVEGYSRMLQHFFGALGKPPDRVTSQEVFAWAYGKGLSGREPSPVTIGARLACLSSFYRFLIRMEIVASNPCDQIQRPKTSLSPPRGLSAEEIRRLLSVIPDTPTGLRDRAIILTLTLTGRRRSEVLNLKASDISQAGGLFYTYRGKGGKQSKRGTPAARLRRNPDGSGGLRQGPRHHGPERVAVAVEHQQRSGRHERHVLLQPQAVPEERGASPGRGPHPPPLSGQAATGRR